MKRLKKFFHFDTILAALLVLILLVDYSHLFISSIEQWILIVLAIIGTIPVIVSAVQAILKKKISVDLLASFALIFSLLSRQWLSAVFISLMLTSSRIFLSYNRARARRSIERLMKLKPEHIKVRGKDSAIVTMKPKDVKVGDTVMIDLGERVPVDGVVVSGTATIDESSITGESLPVTKNTGDSVYSSTLLVNGNLAVETKKIGSDTTLEKIIHLVEQAQIDKPDIHTSAETFATWYLIIVFIGSIIIYAATGNTMFVLAIMLVVCADDIAVAVPLAFLSATNFCAKNGVIVKGASYLEAMRSVKVIFVDKTGTLTKGRLKIEEFQCAMLDKNACLVTAGEISLLSDHPIAKAITEFVKTSGTKIAGNKSADHFTEELGKGITATYGADTYLLGRPEFIQAAGVALSTDISKKIQDMEDHGYNVTLLAENGTYKGFFTAADQIKTDIKDDIIKLKSLGVERIIMLTGDNEKVAKRIADTLGITEYHAGLLPDQKLDFIRKTLSSKYKTMMVGDGVNDAAALSLADIGVAMGSIGLDVTIESANIVLLKDDFSKIPNLILLSQYVMKISNEDFWIWGITNVFGLVLVFASILQPTGAAAYNFLTDFFPIFNSVRVFQLYLQKRVA